MISQSSSLPLLWMSHLAAFLGPGTPPNGTSRAEEAKTTERSLRSSFSSFQIWLLRGHGQKFPCHCFGDKQRPDDAYSGSQARVVRAKAASRVTDRPTCSATVAIAASNANDVWRAIASLRSPSTRHLRWMQRWQRLRSKLVDRLPGWLLSP